MKKKLLFFMFALYLVCLCGCSIKAGKQKENPFAAPDHVTEEMITFPHIMNMGMDIMKDRNGEYLVLGKKASGGVDSLWRMGHDNKWKVVGFLPAEFDKSAVHTAYFFDEENYFFLLHTILIEKEVDLMSDYV